MRRMMYNKGNISSKGNNLTTSVALCTYNGEKYLSEQLESIVNQTILPNELVISDDHSTDGTLNIIHDFIQLHMDCGVEFRLLTNTFESQGVTKNFEKAIKNTNGDIIFLCDQDDVWLENKIELMLLVFKNNDDVKLVFHDSRLLVQGDDSFNIAKETLFSTGILKYVNNQTERIGRKKYLNTVLSGCFIQGMCMAFRRELMENAYPFPNSRRNHDAWILFCAIALDHCMAIKDVLSLYRIHNANHCGLEEYKRKKSILSRISTYDARSRWDILGDYYWCKRVRDFLNSDYQDLGDSEQDYIQFNVADRICIIKKNRVSAVYYLTSAYNVKSSIYNHKSAYIHDIVFCLFHTKRFRSTFFDNLISDAECCGQ